MNSLITRNAAQQFSFQKVLKYQKFKLKDWKFTREAEKRLDKFRFLVYGFTLGISCLYAALHQPQINALPVLWKLWREEGISPKNIGIAVFSKFLFQLPWSHRVLTDEQVSFHIPNLIRRATCCRRCSFGRKNDEQTTPLRAQQNAIVFFSRAQIGVEGTGNWRGHCQDTWMRDRNQEGTFVAWDGRHGLSTVLYESKIR